jgi:hypothetical protein
MTNNQQLENYLNRLDKALSGLNISDRAEIITEIKSHVMDSRESNPDQSLDSILESLGQPENVANRYLLERGVRPVKSPMHPFFKWAVIGVLGTMTIFFGFVLILIFSFSPLIEVDEKNQRVRVLGGLIDVDEQAGYVSIGGAQHIFDEESDFAIVGEIDTIGVKSLKELEVDFTNGKMNFETTASNNLTWNCRASASTDSPKNSADPASALTRTGDMAQLNLNKYRGAKCDIGVPKGINLVVKGGNGKIDIEKPGFNLDLNLGNGKVDIEPDPLLKYAFDTQVTNGVLDKFLSSPDKDALKIKVTLVNGKISNDTND